jgi:hypothetical protein
MAIQSNKKNFGSNRTINYVGKDFQQLRQNLIDYTKTYFPNVYADFNESSPGMVFIEMAAFIGDVLAYYQDAQLKESLLVHATERKNVIALGQALGYKPNVSTPAVTNLTIYQLIPAIGAGINNKPDAAYYLRVKEGMQVTATSDSNIVFRTTEYVDFGLESGRDISVYSRNETTGEPLLYLVSKKVKAISANEKETVVSFSPNSTDYPYTTITDDNLIRIESIYDIDNNIKYYEVPYLAQESIFVDRENVDKNSEYSPFKSSVPYMLELKKVPYRYSVKVNADNTFDIQFGSGDIDLNDEHILPSTKNFSLGITNSINKINNLSLDPSNFLKTNTFGIAPAGKTLTIKYLVGGGVGANVNTGDLTTISRLEFDEELAAVDNIELYDTIKDSIAVENLEPALGGRGAESIEEIRQNALATFGSQNRAVTREDYTVRALSMPEKYGSIAKVYVAADGEVDNSSPQSLLASPKSIAEFTNLVDTLKDMSKADIHDNLVKYINRKTEIDSNQNNPFAINMYTLSYDVNKKLTQTNKATKENIKTYIGEHRLVTDVVNIIDGFIVNIGMSFEVICYANYNKREVLAKCLTEMEDYFNIDKWTFNKPINVSEIELILANVEGVMSVPSVEIYNLCGEDGNNYSPNSYNIKQATIGKIIYPSLDPCVFEVKYPNKDIKGRAL